MPMLIFNLSPVQTGLCYSVGMLIQFWEHTNIKIDIGPLNVFSFRRNIIACIIPSGSNAG